MKVEEKVNSIRQLLYQPGKIGQAFASLQEVLEADHSHRMPEYTSLRAAYHKNEQDFSQGAGIIRREDYMLEFRRIVGAVDQLLGTLLQEIQRLSGKGSALGSEMTKISCNRKKFCASSGRLSTARRRKATRRISIYSQSNPSDRQTAW